VAANAELSELVLTGEDELIDQLRSVRHIARRIHDHLPQHVQLEDLVQAGVLGLLDAQRKFDPGKSVEFQSYAKFRIRGAILDSLRELDWSPRELRKQARAIEDAAQSLTAQLRRVPTQEEIAAALGIDLPEFQELLGDLRRLDIGSFSIATTDESPEEDLSGQIPAAPECNPVSQYERAELKQTLLDAISELPAKEARVLSLYYFEELSMKEIGELLGVGESRISQIHSAAMNRLRSSLQGASSHPLATFTLL
jgi:RNA polymerase sigma factor for flagellar operon FliA